MTGVRREWQFKGQGPRALIAALALGLGLLGLAAPAQAQVTLAPTSAAAGKTVDLAFHVVGDKPDVDTTKVQVLFPKTPGFRSADAPTLAGWSSTVDRLDVNVSSVLWEAGHIAPGASQDFVVTLTIPTTADSAVFRVIQTYSDGSATPWSELVQADGSAPTHPAPVLSITGATPTTVGPSTTVKSSVTATTVAKTAAKKKSDTAASAGRVLILVGVSLVLAMILRARRNNARRDG